MFKTVEQDKQYISKPNLMTFNFKRNTRSSEKPINKRDLIVILRGHIRDSLDNNHLYNYLSSLNVKYNLHIFIHTWNMKCSSVSWRNIEEDTSIVDEELIIKYLKDLKTKKIIIDDDKHIKLNGETKGLIKTTLMPIQGWKNMWYGIHKICKHILTIMSSYNLNPNTLTLNMRLDYFSNSTINQYVRRINNYEFTNKLFDSACENIIFLKNPPQNYGIDNIYTGKFYKIYYTGLLFHSDLDKIIDCYDTIHAQENLVFLLQEYIDKYCDDIIDDLEYIDSTKDFILLKLSKRNNSISTIQDKVKQPYLVL